MKRLLAVALVVTLLSTCGAGVVFWEPERSVAELSPRYGGPASRFVELEHATVHYRDEGTGQVLVLLHGFGSSLHTWDGWVEELAGDLRIIRLDLPGFGLTGPFAHGDYRAERYLEMLDEFLAALGIESCVLAGNSMGGYFAWRYAAHRPETVEKLILVDAAGYPGRAGGKTLRIAKVPVLKDLLTRVTPRFLFARSLREAYADPGQVEESVIDRHFELTLRRGNRQALLDRLETLGEKSKTEAIQSLQQPTLILWGELDTWIPVEHGHRFQRELPNSRLVVYPELGHVPMEEAPELTARDVREFLLRPESSATASSATASPS